MFLNQLVIGCNKQRERITQTHIGGAKNNFEFFSVEHDHCVQRICTSRLSFAMGKIQSAQPHLNH